MKISVTLAVEFEKAHSKAQLVTRRVAGLSI